jgi:hypothetical protein
LQALPANVLSAVGIRLAMAVGTEHPKVPKAVVVSNAVDVIDVAF